MSVPTAGLILTLLFHVLLLLALVTTGLLFPKSFLGPPARTVLDWLPPFLGGQALRDWAAKSAERLAKKHLEQKRNGETASRLVLAADEAAMEAMLPLAEPLDLTRVVACPETGQGRVGVTAPEALALAAYIRQHKSPAEQKRIYELALENGKQIASRVSAASNLAPHPCALQGKDRVCCVFAVRPLRCRPLHAITVARETGNRKGRPLVASQIESPDNGHEQTIAEGIEMGVTRALKSAGLDANIYELNSALAVALAMPDAAERWAKGESVFHNPLL